ncbi:MAG: pilus assembly protein [Pirellulaceae bacterium]
MEFAIVAPVVLSLIVGMVEYINVEFIRQGIAEAAYEGARQGIVQGATAAEVENATSRKMRMMGLGTFDINVQLTATSVDVLVDVPLRGNTFGLAQFITEPSVKARYKLDRERS